MVRNVHERPIAAEPDRVGALLGTLATPGDRLWPTDRWPPMRLDRALAPGAAGGHGPIRYVVEDYEPGRLVRFRFTSPPGFHGTHAFVAEPRTGSGTVLRHELLMRTRGMARLTWPFIFRPLHDALIEDALDRAARALGELPRPRRWSVRVRALRAVLRSLARRRIRFLAVLLFAACSA